MRVTNRRETRFNRHAGIELRLWAAITPQSLWW